MSETLPGVAVLIPTYERPEILDQTVNLLQKNLKYAGPLKILIGDDSAIEQFAEFYETEPIPVYYSFHGEQYGLGRNLNSLLTEAQRQGFDYVIQQDDDHWLVKPLDITPHVKKLIEDETTGAIRLMGVGGHRYRARLDGLYWRIDWESPEVYIASNRPHLKVISRFHTRYGLYPEGYRLGLTEEKFCHQCIDRAKYDLAQGVPTLDVLVPLDVLTESSWQHNEHTGVVSWQAKGF